jgi:BioD-like phosphotransacetylase family protein
VPLIVVTSSQAGEGKTGVAAAIARHYGYQGTPVQLIRGTGDGRAAEDAAYFASLPFAPGSPASAQPLDAIRDPGDAALAVVEAPVDTAVSLAGPKVVLVASGRAPATLPGGLSPAAVVVLAAARSSPDGSASPGGAAVITLPEDRVLAGFSIEEARQLLDADVLVRGDDPGDTCDYLVVAPIASDAGQPYFRRFTSPAVVVRYDRTDMHLAALRADPRCLILTGGRRPMDYLFDAAAARGMPVLLSRTDTENTVLQLEDVFDSTRFQGERKLDRMSELLEGSRLFEALAR